MPVPYHVLIQFGGRLFDVEQWSCGIRQRVHGGALDENSGPSETYAAENVDDVANDIKNWFIRSTSFISNKARLDFVKVNAIGPDGKYADQSNTNVHQWLAPDAPTGTNTATFPQLTTVVSLLTGVARGPAHRGRFYAPTGGMAVGADGKIPQSLCDQMATSAASLIADLNNAPGLDWDDPRVCVVSSLGESGALELVTRTRVGNVVDTQRRRRQNMPEQYSEAIVP